jgi:hypothetical protein
MAMYLVYFMAVWYILWFFGIFYGYLVYFMYGYLVYCFRFIMLSQEKSGNPVSEQFFENYTSRPNFCATFSTVNVMHSF